MLDRQPDYAARDGSGNDDGGGARVIVRMSTMSYLPAATPTQQLQELQSRRRFCIKSQSRNDRSCEAFIARYLGYRPDLPEPERKAIWKEAAAMRRMVEKGGEGRHELVDQWTSALSACSPIILNSAVARAAWDKLRHDTERKMRDLAKTLPAWSWVKDVPGFGALGLGIIMGETGDLANYATKEKVWKRLGLAVIDGERQQRKRDKDAAAAHGYSPSRRAEVWTVADSLFKHQWRGEKNSVPAYAIAPYGEVYARRKAHTAWSNTIVTPKHRDNDARRIMTKAVVEDLWRVWHGKPPRERRGEAFDFMEAA